MIDHMAKPLNPKSFNSILASKGKPVSNSLLKNSNQRDALEHMSSTLTPVMERYLNDSEASDEEDEPSSSEEAQLC